MIHERESDEGPKGEKRRFGKKEKQHITARRQNRKKKKGRQGKDLMGKIIKDQGPSRPGIPGTALIRLF